MAVAEAVRRLRGTATGRLRSLPILALTVHGACNCRCVMCDIWKANADGRELPLAELAGHVEAIRRLRVARVMLTGGEPLLHRNLWALCDLLGAHGVRLTLVTTGLLAKRHADAIASRIDTVVVSIDGPPGVHDAVRRVAGGFARIRDAVAALRARATAPRLIARSVVQRANYLYLADTIAAVREAGFDEISFLAADVTSPAFNRPEPWPDERRAEVAIGAEAVPALAGAIAYACRRHADLCRSGFVVGGEASLRRIHDYYAALAGRRSFPPVRCNAPWVSAVLETGGAVRPCFFQPAYARHPLGLEATLNAPAAVAFRNGLDVRTDEICRRCVCSLYLPPLARV
jgi:MoaA/NifB/PqqE/SkfB family radical SAM enzyme